uniref:helix-turn-helix domain-containing protein n=1 Tax=Brucella pseudintermedia TaxID=370111 RepID=UPI00158A74AF
MLVEKIAAAIGRERLSALDTKVQDIYRLFADGRISESQMESLVAAVEARRAELQGSRRAGQSALPGFLSPRKPAAIEPVRRQSWPKGREAGFWRALTAKDAEDLMKAARRYDDATREKGKRIGPLGPIGLEVLRLLINTARLHRGHLYPALTWIMEKLRRSKSAVVAALAALRKHGFLVWRRRYEPTSNEGRGPQ